MKRLCILAAISFALLPRPALGQDAAATNAAAVAEQQGVDEKFKQLSADIANLRAADQALLDKLSALKEDVQQLRTEQARLAANSSVQDDLKLLARKIEDVDKKRQDDKDMISEEIKKSSARLEKLLGDAASPPPKSSTKTPPAPGAPPTVNGVSYSIKDGDRLIDIVKAYNADFKSKGMKTISLKQVKDANKDVDWTKLKVGQKIVIPLPAS
jgi:cell division protein ZapA (FtsZ GTPase activity inhibitor)